MFLSQVFEHFGFFLKAGVEILFFKFGLGILVFILHQ